MTMSILACVHYLPTTKKQRGNTSSRFSRKILKKCYLVKTGTIENYLQPHNNVLTVSKWLIGFKKIDKMVQWWTLYKTNNSQTMWVRIPSSTTNLQSSKTLRMWLVVCFNSLHLITVFSRKEKRLSDVNRGPFSGVTTDQCGIIGMHQDSSKS